MKQIETFLATKHDLVETIKMLLPLIPLYGNFVEKYDYFHKCITHKLRSDVKLAEKVEIIRKTLQGQGSELGILISAPFQRIFIYKNIAQQLSEYTPKSSSAFSWVTKFVQEIEQTLALVNTNKRMEEDGRKKAEIIHLFPQLQSTISKPHRIFELDGMMEIVMEKNNRVVSYVILFTDCIIFTLGQKFHLFHLLTLKTSKINNSVILEDPFENCMMMHFLNQMSLNLWYHRIKECQEKEIQFLGLPKDFQPEKFVKDYLLNVNLIPSLSVQLQNRSESLKNNQSLLEKAEQEITDLLTQIQASIARYQTLVSKSKGDLSQNDFFHKFSDSIKKLDDLHSTILKVSRNDLNGSQDGLLKNMKNVQDLKSCLQDDSRNLLCQDQSDHSKVTIFSTIQSIDSKYANDPTYVSILIKMNELSIQNEHLKTSLSDMQTSYNWIENKLENTKLLQNQTYKTCANLMQILKTSEKVDLSSLMTKPSMNSSKNPETSHFPSFGDTQTNLIHTLLDQTKNL